MTEKPRLSNAEFIAAALEQIEMADGVFSAHVTLASETLPEALGRLAAADRQIAQYEALGSVQAVVEAEKLRRRAEAAEVERDQLRAQVADLRSRLDWLDRTVNPVTGRNTTP